MKVLVLTAIQEEYEAMCESIDIYSDFGNYCMGFVKGVDRVNVFLALTGIGKVSSAYSTTRILSQQDFDFVFNLGVVGGLTKALSSGDIVCVNKVYQSDFDLSALGSPKGMIPSVDYSNLYVPGYHPQLVTCCTSDSFIDSLGVKYNLSSRFNAQICDMELGAISQVCSYFDIPLISVKVVSDSLYEDSSYYETNKKDVSNKLTDIFIEMIRFMKLGETCSL